MITIGIDAHKSVHVAVAIDPQGRELAHLRVENDLEGWARVHEWAEELGEPCQFGVEGAYSYGRGLAQFLVAQEATVYDINPRWTARSRRRARRQHKNDPLDALAVARIVLQEAPDLPVVQVDDASSCLQVLVSEYRAARKEATRLVNTLHAHLMHLEPRYQARFPSLQGKGALAELCAYRPAGGTNMARTRAATVRRLAARLQLTLQQLAEIEEGIDELVSVGYEPLMAIDGVAKLTTGMLVAYLGPGHRFQSDAQLAAYAGVAPVEASSGHRVRHRLNRRGHRQLNSILHRIAITQKRCSPTARAYFQQRLSEGKTDREAMRALKRYLARTIFNAWKACIPPPPPHACT